jgi:hypothetical protein
MKMLKKTTLLALGILLFSGVTAMAQKTATKKSNQPEMKTYIIEREIPGAAKLTEVQLKGISQTSCGVLKEMGPAIQWVHSYVAGDKIYCIYKAESADFIREHAKKGGFPANSITEVANIISPATADN